MRAIVIVNYSIVLIQYCHCIQHNMSHLNMFVHVSIKINSQFEFKFELQCTMIFLPVIFISITIIKINLQLLAHEVIII